MNRRLVLCLVFTLGPCASALAQTSSEQRRLPSDSTTPAWLPRGALLGTFVRGGALAPEVRVQWQVVFYQGRQDTLGLMLEPGAAVAAVTPDSLTDNPGVSLTSLQFYSLVASLGYTSRRPNGVEWGFQVGSGPLWYRARFQGGAKAQESYVVGLLEGRARIGYRFGPTGLGLTVGYGDPYNYKKTSLAQPTVAGFQLGLYADWR